MDIKDNFKVKQNSQEVEMGLKFVITMVVVVILNF